MITFNGVTKKFPDGTIGVDNLDLHIEEGSFTVFVGPSGCGKTTSMRMINRMIDPSSGTLTVQGRDVTTMPRVQLRLRVGYVIQNAGLMPHRTVVDNVATVPMLRGESRHKARMKALEAMDRVGLDLRMATRYPAQLSGGQQQRVGVARALAADPPILLMDEPFSAVDPVVREDLQKEMRRLQSELAKTIVFVTHDIDEAVHLGDKVAVFGVGGVLQQYADPKTLLSRPATPFVTALVGRDRGYRSLSFRSSATVPIEMIDVVTLEKPVEGPIGEEEWKLVVDEKGSPIGWLDRHGQQLVRAGSRPADVVIAVGSTTTEKATLRQALDSALSSPSGLGVVIDDRGRVAGVVKADAVIQRLAAIRREEAERTRAADLALSPRKGS
ncbi:ABC transporter ATP-binding protein [Arthrobacter sp. NPDC058127]|uniref:ABC transporter ATP-binding protein n=1 Tax=Arthrobacter sp. NPDC058127 TaxID=3346351 RepID=UPI0036EA1FBA